MRNIVSFLAAAAIVAGAAVPSIARPSTDARSTAAERSEARLARALDGRVAGKPVDCIDLHQVRSTEIIDGTAIVYRVGANRLYVNRPDSGADSLRRDDILVTKTHSSRLCRIDTVQLHDRGAHMWRGFVGLGKFVPYSKVPAARG